MTATAVDWERVARGGVHPLQARILDVLAGSDEPLTPKGIAQHLGMPLGRISYHVRQLNAAGLLTLVRTEPRRGALAHFYTIASRSPVMHVTITNELARAVGRIAEEHPDAAIRIAHDPEVADELWDVEAVDEASYVVNDETGTPVK